VVAKKPRTRGNIPQIACLGVTCGKVIEFPEHVDPEGYDGDVRCQECRSLMHIRLEGSRVVKYSLKEDKSETAKGWETLTELKLLREKPDDEVG
jgi:hypothetical protein